MDDKAVNLISLFASSSTLICCALPAVFVIMGAGASFASLVTALPFLITISHYNTYISSFAFVLILIAGYTNYRTYYLPCPSDPELGKACLRTRQTSRYIYYFSVGLFFFATMITYVIPKLI